MNPTQALPTDDLGALAMLNCSAVETPSGQPPRPCGRMVRSVVLVSDTARLQLCWTHEMEYWQHQNDAHAAAAALSDLAAR